MPDFAPSQGLGTLNVALSNFAKEFTGDGYVADLVAPRVPVDRQSFQYLVFDRSNQMAGSTLRSPGGAPRQIKMGYSAKPYFCTGHAAEAQLPREAQAAASQLGFDLKQSATRNVMDKIQLQREVETAALFNSGITQTVALAGTAMWDNYNAASTPCENFAAALYQIKKSGKRANTALLSPGVVKYLINHPEIIARFNRAPQPVGNVTIDNLSAIFGVRCIEAGAVQVDGNLNPSFIWGSTVVIAYVQPVTSQADISAAKTFVDTTQGVDGYEIMEFPDPHLSKKADWVSGEMYYDIALTAQETVFTYTNVVANP